MSQNNYVEKFNRIQQYEPKLKDISVLRNDINKFMPIVYKVIEERKITNADDLRTAMQKLISSLGNYCMKTKYADAFLYELHALEDILKNPSIIDKIYPQIKDEVYEEKLHNANKSRSHKLLLIKALDEISNIENFARKKGLTAQTNIKQISINSSNKKEAKALVQVAIDLLKENNIRNKIIISLKGLKNTFESHIKQNEIDSLKSLHNCFTLLNLTESYVATYNISQKKFGFNDDLKYSEEDFFKGFSEDSLNNLSVKDLCFLDAFWSNRFTKECSRLTSTFCTIDSMNLWQDILDGKTKFDIPDDALIASLQKCKFLKDLIRDSFNIHQNNVTNSEIKGQIDSSEYSKDYTDFYTKLHNNIQKYYSSFFDKSLKKNNFFKDTIFALPFINLEMVMYRKKDACLIPLIRNMLDNNYCKNWGIIRKELKESDNTFIDTLSTNQSMVLLGFDIEGFNMPFRFHMRKSDLLDVVTLNDPNGIIPEYQGYDDFIFDVQENDKTKKKVLPCNLVLPIRNSDKKVIRDNSKIEGPKHNYWEHLAFLNTGSFPKHLTETTQKNKHTTITKRVPIVYSSLTTGQRFIEKDKKLVEVDSLDER